MLIKEFFNHHTDATADWTFVPAIQGCVGCGKETFLKKVPSLNDYQALLELGMTEHLPDNWFRILDVDVCEACWSLYKKHVRTTYLTP